MIPEKTIERLIAYRQFLKAQQDKGVTNLFSHQIADGLGCTAAQVRRDLIPVGYWGNPRNGYSINELIQGIENLLQIPGGINMVVVGVGNLGRAILTYFSNRVSQFTIVAAFDADPSKTERVICGCHCHHVSRMAEVLRGRQVNLGVITTPASEAQRVADALVDAGVRGLVNFAPVRLKIPSRTWVQQMDMTTMFEKIAFFAFHGAREGQEERVELESVAAR